jgi:hypothetical protein
MSTSEELVRRADELRAVVNGHPEHCADVVPRLIAMLDSTDDPEVLVAVSHALGAAWNETACLAMLPYAGHPDERVRFAVAGMLPGGLESDEAKQTVAAALIALSMDSSPEVRDWATFGLGSILDIDTPALRDALRSRLFDSDIDTRLEALVGLAERRDATVLSFLADELRADTIERLVVDAARAFADPSLVPLLVELERRSDVDRHLLERALRTCRSGEQE